MSEMQGIKNLRKSRKCTKEQLAEKIGISVSHLEKIESGARKPEMDTYQKLLSILKADMVIQKETETIQEKCVVKAQEILLSSTETQAIFMTNILEVMAKYISSVT